MRCLCGQEVETYEHFMQYKQYKEIDGLLVRDQDTPVLKKGEKGRREMKRELRREGHNKGLRHMVIRKSLCWGLREHTVAPKVLATQAIEA